MKNKEKRVLKQSSIPKSVKCKECGKKVVQGRKECPHCKTSNPTNYKV